MRYVGVVAALAMAAALGDAVIPLAVDASTVAGASVASSPIAGGPVRDDGGGRHRIPTRVAMMGR
eukprot:3202653-Prymnesium_polylepis.1